MKFTKIATIVALLAGATAAQAGSATSYFNVALKVKPKCVVSVSSNLGSAHIANDTDLGNMSGTDIKFAEQDATDAIVNLSATGVDSSGGGLTAKCSKKTNFSIALTPGYSASSSGAGTLKGLTAGGSDPTIAYQLYQPTVSSGTPTTTVSGNVWGNTTTNDLDLQGKGMATAIAIPVFASITGAVLDVAPDIYEENVTVTVTW